MGKSYDKLSGSRVIVIFQRVCFHHSRETTKAIRGSCKLHIIHTEALAAAMSENLQLPDQWSAW